MLEHPDQRLLLTPGCICAMLLRVRPLAAGSEQTRTDLAADQPFKKGGEGEEEEEEERGRHTVAPVPGSRLVAARRPDGCHLKPGLGLEASQGCAGESAAAAQLIKASLLVKRQWEEGEEVGRPWNADSFPVNSACDGLQRPRRGC